ncbi:heat-inducible transcription repressor HrcA [Alicyclobacillus cellulosilyticus]|uniref:Heat-inducible transcription repressor HrcA n=1 Tax=Alicyclobacillus cellulosilyticus TaxID=1003997 RepID=A0A917KEF0_9BACL|nr:heat-inducible transcriptional repressor HrcA [Alicyclobacillus cellulosilyticus]GGJ09365.1 heat-inducible transcription repressor HrcA [Alicyclobacillus cellulosilyticus]
MLTPRQRLILSAIVEDYVRSAEPVGSRTLSKHDEIHLSAATIRNEMSDLEEMGYLDQPHTSAGRIPSQKGYRFYVDNLMGRVEIDNQTLSVLREHFQRQRGEMERLIHETALVLSELTQYTSIVMGPHVYQEKIRQIQLIPLRPGAAVAILVTDTGQVETRHVQLSEGVSSDDVVRMVNLLNDKLAGVPLYRFRSQLSHEIAEELARVTERYDDAMAFLDELARLAEARERVFVGGTTNILAQPEFRNVDKVRPLLALLERPDRVSQMLPAAQTPGVQVRIGMENGIPTLQDCTVVSATYTIQGVPVGSIGVLGPTRMNYARVIRILEYVSHALSDWMTKQASG